MSEHMSFEAAPCQLRPASVWRPHLQLDADAPAKLCMWSSAVNKGDKMPELWCAHEWLAAAATKPGGGAGAIGSNTRPSKQRPAIAVVALTSSLTLMPLRQCS
jgi:hypothetical protein